MSARYLVSRSFDILFALAIGVCASTVRIRREERERWHYHHSSDPSSLTDSLPQISSSVARSSSSVVAPPSSRHASATAVEERLKNMDHEPTIADTWETLKMRVQKVDVRTWDVRELWKRKNAWGVVEPNQ